MTLVVADSSPVRYLVVIGAADVLPKLYDRIILLSVVVAGLTDSRAPSLVREWALNLPSWIEVLIARNTPAEWEDILDSGEAAAISLAREIAADLILLDERKARRVAVESGFKIAGTVGILEAAAERDLIDLSDAFKKLEATNFRIEPEFVAEALRREVRRKLGGRS